LKTNNPLKGFIFKVGIIFIKKAMMPLWVYTLGDVLTKKANINIPVYGLLGNLFLTVAPCVAGVVLNIYLPKIKETALKWAKPMAVFNIITIVLFMLYVKSYVFQIIKVKDWLTLGFIPGLGFLLAAFVSFICNLSTKQIVTVAIETSIQNFFIPALIIFTNFPSPESDYGKT
jgi:predicted Na+-dependent transporter